MSLKGKVAVMPCTGVGQVMGTITRQAAYRVCEDERPDGTVLLCLPALVADVQEDLDMVAECPVVAIEGCKERCATRALAVKGAAPTVTVSVPHAMRGSGLKVQREARRSLTAAELAVVDRVVERVVREVDRLLSRG